MEIDALREAVRELLAVIAEEGPAINPDHPEDHGITPATADVIRALTSEPEYVPYVPHLEEPAV